MRTTPLAGVHRFSVGAYTVSFVGVYRFPPPPFVPPSKLYSHRYPRPTVPTRTTLTTAGNFYRVSNATHATREISIRKRRPASRSPTSSGRRSKTPSIKRHRCDAEPSFGFRAAADTATARRSHVARVPLATPTQSPPRRSRRCRCC